MAELLLYSDSEGFLRLVSAKTTTLGGEMAHRQTRVGAVVSDFPTSKALSRAEGLPLPRLGKVKRRSHNPSREAVWIADRGRQSEGI